MPIIHYCYANNYYVVLVTLCVCRIFLYAIRELLDAQIAKHIIQEMDYNIIFSNYYIRTGPVTGETILWNISH